MKKIALIVSIIILTTLLVVQPKIHPSEKGVSELTIGFILPLTGKSASIGENMRNAILLAQKELEQRGVDTNFIIEDDSGEASKTLNAARKLIDSNNVHLIVGPAKSDSVLAIAPIVNERKVVLLSPTAGASSISQAGDYVFRNIELPSAHGEAGSKFIKDTATGTSVSVFTANASNAKSYSEAFIRSAKIHSLDIRSENIYNPDETDFRTMIHKVITQDSPSSIFVGVATAKDAGLITTQIRDSGYTGIVLLSVAAKADELFSITGERTSNLYISSPYFDIRDEDSESFKYNSKYFADYAKNSDAFAANTFDAINILYTAFSTCGSDTECIKDQLYKLQGFNGAGGITTFDSNGDVLKPVMILRVSNGQFVVATSY